MTIKNNDDYRITNSGTLYSRGLLCMQKEAITWGVKQKIQSLFASKRIQWGRCNPNTLPILIESFQEVASTMNKYNYSLSDIIELCGLNESTLSTFLYSSEIKIYLHPGSKEESIVCAVRGPIVGSYNKIIRTIYCSTHTIQNEYFGLIETMRGSGLGKAILQQQEESAKKLGINTIKMMGETKWNGNKVIMKGNTIRLKRGFEIEDATSFIKRKNNITSPEILHHITMSTNIYELSNRLSHTQKKIIGIEGENHTFIDTFPNQETFQARKQCITSPETQDLIFQSQSVYDLITTHKGETIWSRCGIQYIPLTKIIQ